MNAVRQNSFQNKYYKNIVTIKQFFLHNIFGNTNDPSLSMNLLEDSHIKVDNWFGPTDGWTQKFEKPLNMMSMRPSLVHVFN